MKKILQLALMVLPLMAKAQDCPDFTAPAAGKPLKVIIYTESAQCFTVYKKDEAINTAPTKRITFYTDLMGFKARIVLANGVELEQRLLAGEGQASIVFEVTHNDKKDTYNCRARFAQGKETEEGKRKREEEFAKLQQKNKDEQARRDKEWNDGLEADRKKREEEQKKTETISSSSSTPTTTNNTNSSQSNTAKTETSSSSHNSSSGATSGSNHHKARFLYEGVPIANTLITLKTPQKEIIAAGTTDSQGKVVLNTNFPDGRTDADIYGEKANSNWKIEGALVFILNGKSSEYIDCDLAPIVKYIAEQMGMSPDMLAKSWGFK